MFNVTSIFPNAIVALNRINSENNKFLAKNYSGQLNNIKESFKKFYGIVLENFKVYADRNKITLENQPPINRSSRDVTYEYDINVCNDYYGWLNGKREAFGYQVGFTFRDNIFEIFKTLDPKDKNNILQLKQYVEKGQYLYDNQSEDPCMIGPRSSMGVKLIKIFGISVNPEEEYKLVIMYTLLTMIRDDYDTFAKLVNQPPTLDGGNKKIYKSRKNKSRKNKSRKNKSKKNKSRKNKK